MVKKSKTCPTKTAIEDICKRDGKKSHKCKLLKDRCKNDK